MPCIWSAAVDSSASARSGSRASRLRAASSLKVRLARDGPRPSCRVAAQPAALLLARGHQPLAGLLQVAGEVLQVALELHGVRHDAGLAGHVAQQALIGHAEGRVRCARRQQQVAGRLALVGQGQDGHRGAGALPELVWAGIGGHHHRLARLRQRDGHVGQLQRLGDGLDHRVQGGFGRGRGLEAPTQSRKHGVGIVPLAVDKTIGSPL